MSAAAFAVSLASVLLALLICGHALTRHLVARVVHPAVRAVVLASVWARRNVTRPDAWPRVTLPPEVGLCVLASVAAHCDASDYPHRGLWKVLSLSRATHRALVPIAYACLHIRTVRSLQRLRATLVQRPELGAHVSVLVLGGCGTAPPLALEQVLLAVRALHSLTLDSDTCTALCRSQFDRLERVAQPKQMQLRLGDARVDVRRLLAAPLCRGLVRLTFECTPLAAMYMADDVRSAPSLAVVCLEIDACTPHVASLRRAVRALAAHGVRVELDAPPSMVERVRLAALPAQHIHELLSELDYAWSSRSGL